MDNFPPRLWTPEDSPSLFLGFLGIETNGMQHEKLAELLRKRLIIASDSQLEDLAQKMANHRRNGGEDAEKTFHASLCHLRKEREAVLHPQMG